MTETCDDCGDSTAWGSGKFVNRIPATNGWLCADCQAIECDECDTPTIEWDHPKHDEAQIWCVDCLDKMCDHNAWEDEE